MLTKLPNSKEDSRRIVLELAEDLTSQSSSGSVDIIKLANEVGVEVYEKPLKDDEAGYIQYDSDNDEYFITVNAVNHPNRKRFTIAHELAHFVLHREKIKELGKIDRNYENSLDAKEEKKADELASKILMPKKVVEKLAKN